MRHNQRTGGLVIATIGVLALLLLACSGGGTPAAATPSAPPSPSITRDRAIEIALVAVPGWKVNSVQSGTFGELGSSDAEVLVPSRPGPDTPVWRVDLSEGAGPTGTSYTTLIIGADGSIIQRSTVAS
jgi:hypothetical protein